MRVVVLVAIVMLAAPSQAADPAVVCKATKLLRAGSYDLCLLKATAKALRRGEAPDTTKCDEKLAAAWARAEAKAGGTCPTTGDAAAIAGQVSSDVAAIIAALMPPTTVPTTTTTTTLPSGPSCGTWPGCGGACPAGSTCWATILPASPGFASDCTCLPSVSTPCADTGGNTVGAATCGGACPAGQVCTTLEIAEAPFDATCGCIPAGSTPCVNAGAPACGGACPTGLACAPDFLFPCTCQ